MIDWPGAIHRPCPFCGVPAETGCVEMNGDRPPRTADGAVHRMRAFVPSVLGVRSAAKNATGKTHVRHPWSAFRGLCGVRLIAVDVQGTPAAARCRDCRVTAAWMAEHPDADPPQPRGEPIDRPTSIAAILGVDPPPSTLGTNPGDNDVTTSVTTPPEASRA